MHKGSIAVQTENIFPIIKKFLYSDHEIFLRELVANAVDATTKLKVLAQRGEATGEIGDTTIQITTNKDNKQLIISDKGIGMTADEVTRYLNQIAFSSAAEFLDKYKDAGIIGHFGLGFYSAFMVAKKVEVVTRSWKAADNEAVRWTCEGDPSYTLETGLSRDRGTDVILHLDDENLEFLETYRMENLLKKYCKYLPVPIQFGTKKDYRTEGEGDNAREIEQEVPNIINNPSPIWKKSPASLSDEDYRNFYHEQFSLDTEPMFWIHLNIDHPFNLTGVLYFPKLGNALETHRNRIHLYCNQVFVTDDVREIVPEWLLLLHGVIDSPDIPLNVSRSFLQSDRNVKMLSEHITKKVADKLLEIFKNDRADFEQKWRDLGVFVKYGMITDTKFFDRALQFALVQNVENKFFLLEDYKNHIKDQQTDKYGKVIAIYTQNKDLQDGYIKAAQKRGYDILKMEHVIDAHWMQTLEMQGKFDFTFVRVDADTTDNLVQKDEQKTSILTDTDQQKLKNVFDNVAKNQAGARVQLAPMSPSDFPVSITKPEFLRRFRDMQALQGMEMNHFPESYNLVVNTNHPIIAQKLLEISDPAGQEKLAKYLTDIALLNQGMLQGEALTQFVADTLEKIAQ